MQKFSCKTKVLSGAGAASYLKELGSRRLLLVTDPYFAQNGTARSLAALSGAEYEIFSKVKPDPGVELVAEGAVQLRQFQPDTVVALGGGSAMDTAKAMVHFSGSKVCFVAIPTTSGSGSEVTDFAVLTHENVKYPLVDASLRPDVAILDSDLLEKLPKSLVADTGFDVLCHALEAYVAKDAGTFSDAFAREAFCITYRELLASYGGNLQVRLPIHEAATMAGIAFTHAGLGLAHALSHALGGAFHIPHGRLNAIVLPAVIRCNAYGSAAKYATLARAAGIAGAADGVAVRNLRNGLQRLRRELDMPATLKEAGVDPKTVQNHSSQLVKAVLADPCCKTNPVPAEASLVRQILEEVAGGV